jgi:hypothetical protein
MPITAMTFDRNELAAFCGRHNVAELSLFGSILRDDFRPNSDVDVLVRFQSGKTLSLESYIRMREELSALFEDREVDLVEAKRLVDPYRRHEIMRTREVIYGDRY